MDWLSRLRRMLRRGRLPAEYEREAEFHIAERADDLMAQGLSHREAVLEARRRFGKSSLNGNRSHSSNLASWLESLFSDLRYAARSLRRSPVFTIVAILSLGLGIGANTAIFSLYNALVLRTLPVQNPEELMQVMIGEDRSSFTNPQWEELHERQGVLSGPFAFSGTRFDLADGGEVRNAQGYWVSGDFFGTLGVLPVLGRVLASGDDYRGCPPVAVVSYGFWQREFGGAGDAIGKALTLNGHPFEVVGVVEPSFSGVEVGTSTDIYSPLCAQPIAHSGDDWLDRRSTWFLNVVGRIKPGNTEEQAASHLAALAPGIFEATVPQNWGAEGQRRYREYTFTLRTAATGISSLRGGYREALQVLMVLVGVVLLIACGNVANLLLARSTKRQREVSIRRAIGSGRGRLVRLLVVESMLLSFMSALAGLLFANWASEGLVGILSSQSTVWLDLRMDARVLGFTSAVAALTGILFGLAPAWRITGVAPNAAIRVVGREIGEGHGRFAVGKLLVVGQLALTMSLIAGAGLLIGTLTSMLTHDTGFNRNGVLIASVDKRKAEFSQEESSLANQQMLEGIRILPGVQAASASMITPISNTEWNNYVEVDGYTPPDRSDALVWFNSISEGFFATLETPILAGRDFDTRDVSGSPLVAVVNETMARTFFGELRTVGRRFRRAPSSGGGETYEVIGVVADTKYRTIDEEVRPIAYVSLEQRGSGSASIDLQVRTAAEPAALIQPTVSLIEAVHPRISVRFATLDDQVSASLARPRVLAVLSGFFGVVALLLAVIGLYGTLAHRVASRRNEIGVRLALGAARARVLGMVLGEVGRMTSLGIALGVACAIAGTRLLRSFLFGVEATDPTTTVLSAAILSCVALAGGALPAWHAARLDPMETLREE